MDSKKAIAQLKKINEIKGDMRLAAESWDSKFKTLISTLLSARTLDETTIKVCSTLFEKFPDAKKLSEASLVEIQSIIKPVNFYITKSKNIIGCAKILSEKYDGNVPLKYDRLIELPGVGNKTANVFLSENGYNTIGVDTHVYFIAHYLDWSNGKGSEDVENDLKKLFLESYWKELNSILFKFLKKYTSFKKKK